MTKHERRTAIPATREPLTTIADLARDETGGQTTIGELASDWAALNEALFEVRRAESGGIPLRTRSLRKRADRLAARVVALLDSVAEAQEVPISGVTAIGDCIMVQSRSGTVSLDCRLNPELGVAIAADLVCAITRNRARAQCRITTSTAKRKVHEGREHLSF